MSQPGRSRASRTALREYNAWVEDGAPVEDEYEVVEPSEDSHPSDTRRQKIPKDDDGYDASDAQRILLMEGKPKGLAVVGMIAKDRGLEMPRAVIKVDDKDKGKGKERADDDEKAPMISGAKPPPKAPTPPPSGNPFETSQE